MATEEKHVSGFRRIALFVITNLAVIVLLSIVASLLGVDRFLTQNGLNMGALLGFAAVFGFGGAFISLLMSKQMALWSTGAQVIESPTDERQAWLLSTVQTQSHQAGIGMPAVAIYDSPEPNAFATGARRNSALVAVSTGLLDHMDQREVEAVLAHEVSHVANGDMVTMTLLQGVLNTFVIALSRVVGMFAGGMLSGDEEDSGERSPMAYFMTSIVAQIVFGALASLIVMAFSRHREFRADAGAAKLVGAGAMIEALDKLREPVADREALPQNVSAFGIRSGGSIMALFSSHPPIEDRIEALRSL
ncbi:MAG: protease HtpX [Myxococcota bacterium]